MDAIDWFPQDQFAFIEKNGEADTHEYAAVVAVERFDDPEDGPQIRYWLPGNPPVPSDLVKERTGPTWFVNHVRYISPDEQAALKTQGVSFGWNWA